MNYGVAVTSDQLQAYFNKLREREADLKAGGCWNDALPVLQKSGTRAYKPLSLG